jgi:16S rRNA (guanine966-N2)-methyltransferase
MTKYMTVNVLGGIAKGFNIKVIEHKILRPTSVMLKRKFFDAYQDLSDCVFIDLCAGSGSVGIEAWSRGAQEVFFCEADGQIFLSLNQNVEKLKNKFLNEFNGRNCHVKRGLCQSFIQNLSHYFSKEKLGYKDKLKIFFLDPPYQNVDLVKDVLDLLFREQKSLSPFVIWLESELKKGDRIENLLGDKYLCQDFFEAGSKYMAICLLK